MYINYQIFQKGQITFFYQFNFLINYNQFQDYYKSNKKLQQLKMINKPKSGHQIKALFLKNLSIQKRQPCTNLCQILTPIICLLLTIVIRNAAIDNIPSQNDTIFGLFPQFGVKFNDYSLIDQLDELIYREDAQWYLFDYENKEDEAFIGVHDGVHQESGLLGNIKYTYYYDVFNTSLNYPYYLQYLRCGLYKKSNISLHQELFKRYQFLNSDTLYSLKNTITSQHLPDGAVHFKTANNNKLEARLSIKDVRQFLFYRPNGVTQIRMKSDPDGKHYSPFYTISQGFLGLMDMVSQAYIKKTTGKSMVSGYKYLPVTGTSSAFVEMLINTVASIIFPLSLSLLLPVFLYLIVLEKQQKLIQMMRMNGMNMLNYWGINFLYNLIISLLTNMVFCLFGYFFLQNAFFDSTSHGFIFVVLLGWILSQIGMSMLFQVFLSGSRAANIIGYLVAIWTNLIGATLSIALFQYPIQLPIGFRLWPTFSFNRLFYLMFTNCSMDKCVASFDNVTPQMWSCITVLYCSWIIFSLVGMYLFQVVPQQYGVSQPILFPIYYVIQLFKRKENVIEDGIFEQESANDASIDQQKVNIKQIYDLSTYPLICNGLTKRYKSGKLAVNNFTLMIEDKTIFGLLGPNGAGKTTLLSMITGIFQPTSGSAFVGGYSIKDQIDKVHLQMGVCPQFDIVWPNLTVQQHFYFYARLRGVNGKDQKQKVQQILEEVNLVTQRNFRVHQLSGGMKRRMSIGISLVGDPRIVFMDEPTTGLDPQNRRHLWQVLSKCREKRSLFITTHLMQEAEALCDKIGIITKGNIRTVGDQFKLKQIYGKGYFVSVSLSLQKQKIFNELQINNDYEDEENPPAFNGRSSILTQKYSKQPELQGDIIAMSSRQKIDHLKEKLLTKFYPATISKEISGMIKINVGNAKVSQILQSLRQLKEQDMDFEWAISDSTLQDVFLQVILRFDCMGKPSLLDSLDQQIM